MSEELVEAVRLGYEAINRGDLEAAFQGQHPDVVWIVPDILPEMERTYRGRDTVIAFWKTWLEIFEDLQVEVEEYIDAGDTVIAMARLRGHGRDSGAEVVTPSFPHIWTIEDGVVVRVEMMPTKAEALKAVRLDR